MRCLLIRSLCIMAALSHSAMAQDCGTWLPGPKPPDFPSGKVPRQFVTNGTEIFARVQSSLTENELWRFDGVAWNLMPWDRLTMGEPDAIAFENNQLAVGSRRLSSLGSGNFNLDLAVHTWDGSSFQTFATWSEPFLSCTGMAVQLFDLCFLSDAWYITGEITGPCIPGDFVYKMHPNGPILIGEVAASAARNQLETFGGAVYLGGSFASIYNPDANIQIAASNLASWTGTSWNDAAGGVNARVVTLGLWQENPAQPLSTQLIVAGKITQAGTVTVAGVAARSQAGHWNALGSVSWPPDLPFGGTWLGPAPMVTIANGPTDTDLVLFGMIFAGNSGASGLARWTGADWVPFGLGGLNSTASTAVYYDEEVVAGGGFSSQSAQGGEQLFGVGRFDGSAWRTLSKDGTDATVRALFAHDGVVYAGGDFTTMDGVLASHIAAHTDNGWEALSSGTNGTVRAIAFFGNEIVVGGAFNQAGGIPVQNIAAWNGATWRSLGTGLDAMVEGLALWNNQLVAVGEFQTDDGQSTSLPGVAVWNGNNWIQLHEDVDATEAHSVAVHNGQLYLGGGFAGGIVRFTGSQLEIVAGGVSGGSVFALTSLAGSLYAGGDFLSPQPWIIRLSGNQFFPLTNNGSNANFAGDVRTIFPGADGLYVGGSFQVTTGLGPTTRNMASWDGVTWRALADAFPEFRVHAATVNGDRVWAGGEFLGISNETVSAYVAERVEASGFIQHPESQDICADDGTKNVGFSAAIVPDAGTQFRWQKNQVNVNDSLRISGATTQTLSIFGALPSDAGDYRLRATDECGNESFSEVATLTFDGCCPGDLNNDNAANLVDADLFADCLAGPQISSSCNHVNRANFDGDVDVDLRDAAAFQRAFAGTCP